MSMNPSNFRPNNSAETGQQYLDATIRTASPAKLRLMLLERSIEVARMLASVWKSGESKGKNEHSLSLMEIIGELLSGIAGGSNETENKLCLQVADLYVFLLKHLVVAEENSDWSAVDEIRLVLEAETETWRAAVAQENTLAQENASPATTSTVTSDESVSGGLNFSA